MEPNKILQSDVLDLVFEGRNKEYGAYELRKSYNKRILVALSSILLIVVGVFLYSMILSKLFAASDDTAELEKKEIVLEEIAEEEDHLVFELGRSRPRVHQTAQPCRPIRRHDRDVLLRGR